MCDLFAMSAQKDYSAPHILPVFAHRAKKNMDGWGIGFFKKQSAVVEKSAAQVFYSGHFHDGFQRLARIVKSRIIICHLRFKTSGLLDECHAHPFVLNFGGHEWLFAHNGRAPAIESYRSRNQPVPDAISDSAKVFEYIRDSFEERRKNSNGFSELYSVILESTARMIEEYPGEYNFLMSNGRLLLAFTNHRQFMVLKGTNTLKGAMVLTTLEKGLSRDKWTRMARTSNRNGLLMAISGNDIILKEPL